MPTSPEFRNASGNIRIIKVLLEMERRADNGELIHIPDLSDLSPEEAAQMLAENAFDESEDY